MSSYISGELRNFPDDWMDCLGDIVIIAGFQFEVRDVTVVNMVLAPIGPLGESSHDTNPMIVQPDSKTQRYAQRGASGSAPKGEREEDVHTST